jgi:hypothetical protein
MINSRRPLPPDPDAVEQQYGEDAELYAEVRAETAAATGLEESSEEWRKVEAKIDHDDGADPDAAPGQQDD